MAKRIRTTGHSVKPGQRYGRLLVLRQARWRITEYGRVRRFWVRCDCDKEKIVGAGSIQTGDQRSCGCAYHYRHGEARKGKVTPEYRAWQNMKSRCYNKNQRRWKDYGGRGIRVCTRWLKGEDGVPPFECFLSDVGRRPSPAHSLDRRDNDGHYAPDNTRWAIDEQQRKSQRRRTRVPGSKRWLAEHSVR